MFHRFCAAAAAAMLAFLVLGTGAMAVPVFPPGVRVGLEPAPGLSLSRRFPGFEDAARHVAVTILDLPAVAYDKLMRSANAKDQQGMTGVKRESFLFASGTGLLVSGEGNNNGLPVHRWFLVASAAEEQVPNLAALVRVEVPDAARTLYTDAIVRRMLASVTFRRVPLQEMVGLLPFKLTAMAGFKVVKALPDGLVVADDGKEAPSEKPYAIITIGRDAPDQPADRDRFAHNLLTATPLRNLKMTLAEPIRINGAPGHEIRAEAEGLHGEPIMLVQWLRFGGIGGGFLRIVAVAHKQDWDATFNRFRVLRDGIVFK
jgi:hypothetical protein